VVLEKCLKVLKITKKVVLTDPVRRASRVLRSRLGLVGFDFLGALHHVVCRVGVCAAFCGRYTTWCTVLCWGDFCVVSGEGIVRMMR